MIASLVNHEGVADGINRNGERRIINHNNEDGTDHDSIDWYDQDGTCCIHHDGADAVNHEDEGMN